MERKSNLQILWRHKYIYTTKGRGRFHWAAIPLKPHKVGNICYMTYRYSVLYFPNLSLKHFFPTENGNFFENIQIRRPLSFRVLTCRACPIEVLPNRRWKTLYIVSASVCSIKGRLKTPQANPTDETHIYNKIKRTTIWFCVGGGRGIWQFMSSRPIIQFNSIQFSLLTN